MTPNEAAILDLLKQSYGSDKAGWIFGAYRLAETAVALDAELRAAQAARKPKPTRKRGASGPTPLRGAESDTA